MSEGGKTYDMLVCEASSRDEREGKGAKRSRLDYLKSSWSQTAQ